MPNISIPKSFFVKERRMYSQWQFAFWREFFQNSIDAGATRIDIELEQVDNVIRVEFRDNGCGMTREILENVYFSLGATTKGGEDQVGGFGRARILTCFSMKSYKIHTLDNLVIGEGGEYEIQKTDALAGTNVTVEMEDESLSDLNS
jgi:HSP90 family molecular chaperone